jgi:hypothetical protein
MTSGGSGKKKRKKKENESCNFLIRSIVALGWVRASFPFPADIKTGLRILCPQSDKLREVRGLCTEGIRPPPAAL